MKRRDFIKGSVALSSVAALGTAQAVAKEAQELKGILGKMNRSRNAPSPEATAKPTTKAMLSITQGYRRKYGLHVRGSTVPEYGER